MYADLPKIPQGSGDSAQRHGQRDSRL